jgi:hypothetical protein
MSEHEQSITGERSSLTPEPAGDDVPPASSDGEQPSTGGPRLVLPAIDWARLARAVRTGLRVGIFVVVVSVALGTAAFVAASLYGQYGAVRDAPNAQAWAGLPARFAGQAPCASCHAPQAAAQDASTHLNVSCEACHGPGAAHSVNEAAARATALTEPASVICSTCHGATAGRPTAFSQVDPARHYSGGQCLRCHDPHSIVAVRPPTVSHPLANLPECTTCHAPDGLRKIPTGHELVEDGTCLACHRPAADAKP